MVIKPHLFIDPYHGDGQSQNGEAPTISIRVTQEAKDQLKEIARSLEVNVSYVARKAIEQYLAVNH